MIVDESVSPYNGSGYGLTQVHHIDGNVVRVRVQRDNDQQYSSAIVEVLTPARTWTVLVTAPPASWHHRTPPVSGDALPLLPVAKDLVARAARVLDVRPVDPRA